MLVNITGGSDLTLYDVDEAAERVTRVNMSFSYTWRSEVIVFDQELEDPHANIIFGSTFDESLNGTLRTSIVATGITDLEKK